MTDLLSEIERLTRTHGHTAVDAGFARLRDTRIADSSEGRAAIDVLDALVDRYGDDAVAWVFGRIRARLDRRVDRHGNAAQRDIDEAAERAMERLRAGNGGEGHQ